MKPRATLDTSDRLLSIADTAELLGVTVGTLNTWRSNKRYDLAYVRVGRCIRYRLSDVLEWINSRTVQAAGA